MECIECEGRTPIENGRSCGMPFPHWNIHHCRICGFLMNWNAIKIEFLLRNTPCGHMPALLLGSGTFSKLVPFLVQWWFVFIYWTRKFFRRTFIHSLVIDKMCVVERRHSVCHSMRFEVVTTCWANQLHNAMLKKNMYENITCGCTSNSKK